MVLTAGPVDAFIVICPCEVRPVKDTSVLDSWVDDLPMIVGDWFWFVVAWVDDSPRAGGAGCDYMLSPPLGQVEGGSILEFSEEVWFKPKGASAISSSVQVAW